MSRAGAGFGATVALGVEETECEAESPATVGAAAGGPAFGVLGWVGRRFGLLPAGSGEGTHHCPPSG